MSTSHVLLAAFFLVGGVGHFVFPDSYVDIMPPWLPQPLLLVYISGVCEIAGGLGVLTPLTRRAAGIGLIGLSIAVFPANVQMLLNDHRHHAAVWWQVLLALRLPLQILLIYWVWTATQPRRTDDRRRAS